MIERDFDVPFVADLALREKQIQQNYRPIMAVHKWFARRPGTLFRALLLSESLTQICKHQQLMRQAALAKHTAAHAPAADAAGKNHLHDLCPVVGPLLETI